MSNKNFPSLQKVHIGETYGDMKVIDIVGNNNQREIVCLVKCEVCGKIREVSGRSLRRGIGATHGISCSERYKLPDLKYGDIIGDMIILDTYKTDKNVKMGKVKCSICGKERDVVVKDLNRGKGTSHKTSCNRKVNNYNYHGLRQEHPRLFSIWYDIVRRTNNENCKGYKTYGGKGIKNKFSSFEEFVELMADSYYEHVAEYGEHNTTIDRIDNTKGYSYKNCRWATYETQSINKSTTVIFNAISPEGKEYVSNNMTKFAKDHNLNRKNIRACLDNKKDNYKGWKFSYSDDYVIFI